MIILIGECGCGKTEIERVLIQKYGYKKRNRKNGKKTVCILTPDEFRQIKRKLQNKKGMNVCVFYIKVPRKDRLVKMFQRGDDIDAAIHRDRIDLRRYQGIEKEVDFVLNNDRFFSDPENMAYWITECIKGNYKNK